VKLDLQISSKPIVLKKAVRTLRYQRYLDDFAAYEVTNIWTDTAGSPDKIYVVF
jgi:adenine-specific DNA-methyltransferase